MTWAGTLDSTFGGSAGGSFSRGTTGLLRLRARNNAFDFRVPAQVAVAVGKAVRAVGDGPYQAPAALKAGNQRPDLARRGVRRAGAHFREGFNRRRFAM